MNENVLIMRRAKERLSGQWVPAVVGSLIVMAILSVASCTYIGELLVSGPLSFGYVLFLMCLADTRQGNYNLLFEGFNRFGQTLVAGLLISLAVSIGAILLIVPGIILSLGFSMTFFIMADDRDISGVDAMQESWNMMKGHKWDLFCLSFRFFGWALLCVLTCGIGFLWLYPYMTLSYFYFYRRLRYGTF